MPLPQPSPFRLLLPLALSLLFLTAPFLCDAAPADEAASPAAGQPPAQPPAQAQGSQKAGQKGPSIYDYVSIGKDGVVTCVETLKGFGQTITVDLARHEGTGDANAHNGTVVAFFVDGAKVRAEGMGSPALAFTYTAPTPGPHDYRIVWKTTGRVVPLEDADRLAWPLRAPQPSPKGCDVYGMVVLPDGARFSSLEERKTWGVLKRWYSAKGGACFRAVDPASLDGRYLPIVSVTWPSGVVARPERKHPGITSLVSVGKDGVITCTETIVGLGPRLSVDLDRFLGSTSPFVTEHEGIVVELLVDGVPVQAEGMNMPLQRFTYTAPVPGAHDYRIVWKTRDRVRFGLSEDHLAWLVSGTPMPSGSAVSCTIRLPEGAAFTSLYESGMLPMTRNGIAADGSAWFKVDPELARDRSKQLSVGGFWPAGIVDDGGAKLKIRIVEGVTWGSVLLVILLCYLFWRRWGRDEVSAVVVPRFAPPQLSDGTMLSPGAVAYVNDAASLTSRGFTAILLSLASRGIMRITGSGTRGDPYMATQTGSLNVISQKEMRSTELARWREVGQKPGVLDRAERTPALDIFSGGERDEKGRATAALSGRGAGYVLGEASVDAFMELDYALHRLWNLRFREVAIMHCAAYALVCLVLFPTWIVMNGSVAVALASITVAGGLSAAWFLLVRRLHAEWIRWRECDWTVVASLVLFGLNILILAVYDWLLTPAEADYPLYPFFHQPPMEALRLFCLVALPAYISWYARSFMAALIPLRFIGYLLLLALAGGVVWAMGLPGTAGIATVVALLVPTAFAPIMKQPTEEGAHVLSQIKGFAMYIEKADAPRLNTLNPPEATPEVFERVMPYAVALGLESAWGAQFADKIKVSTFRKGRRFLLEYQYRVSGD